MSIFSKKELVTLEMVQSALYGQRNSEELNPIFFDDITGKDDQSKNKNRGSVQNFLNAFGLLKESQIGDLISQSSQQDEEEAIEEILQEEQLEYLLNPDLVESDLVNKEFSKLSTRAGHYETNQELKKLEKVNRIIEKRLNNNCIKHYGSIAKGLKNLESIGDDNIVSIAKIQVVRNILKDMRQQVTTNSIKVIKLKRQSTNTKNVLEKFEEIYRVVGTRFKLLKEVITKPEEYQFLKCGQINKNLKEIEGIVSSLKGDLFSEINAFNQMEVMVKQKQQVIIEIVKKNWNLLHKKYDEEQFNNNIFSQFILEKRNQIEELEKLKNAQLIQISDDIISRAVKQYVDLQDGFDEENIIFNLNYISKENFLPFLQQLFQQFTKLMVNYHYISRWFVKNDSNESVLVLATDWSENIIDDANLTPQQQLDTFLEYVQQKKNIYLQERKVLWQTIEHKVRQIINNTYQINGFTEEELITFLKLTSDFIGTGIQYSNSESENIRQCVNQKIVSYYQYFIVNFQKSVHSLLRDEKYEQIDYINYEQLKKDIYALINTPLKPEFINSIQYILPELKVENIESYSPLNNAKYLYSTPNLRNNTSLTRIDGEVQESQETPTNLFTSPDFNAMPSIDQFPSEINNRIELKLSKCDSSTPVRDVKVKIQKNIIEDDPSFVGNIKFLTQSSLNLIIGLMNCMRLIKILWPVQYQIFEAMMEVIDYYVYGMYYQLCDKSFKEKLIKKFVLEHMNVNNENLIETHETKMDFLMDQYIIHKKFYTSRPFFIELYNKFGDDTFTASSNQLTTSLLQSLANSNGNTNAEEKPKHSFEAFEGLTFELPSFNYSEEVNQKLSSRVISSQSFLSLMHFFDKIKPFLKIYLKNNEQEINERFKKYDEIKEEYVSALYSSFLPIYIKNQVGCDAIVNNVKWDVKDISKDIKPSGYISIFKSFLQKHLEQINTLFKEEQYEEKRKSLYSLLVEQFFKAIVDIYSRIKTISFQSRAQLLADIKQIILDVDELLVMDTKILKSFLEKYMDMLQFCNAEDIHTFIVKYRDIYPYRAFKSLFSLSEAGVVMKKNKKQENSIQMMKNYQIFLRDLK